LNRVIGWILDTYIQGDKAIIWIRIDKGEALRLIDDYRPSFYIMPKTFDDGNELFRMLQDSSNTASVSFEEKRTVLREDSKERMLRVEVDKASNFKRIVNAVELLQFGDLYNVDLLHVQQYLFTRLNVAPSSKVEVEYRINGEENLLDSVKTIDDSQEIPPPPFSTLIFNINVEGRVLTPDPNKDPIARMKIRFNEEEIALEGKEPDILEGFSSTIKDCDPDFLVCPQFKYTVNYLFQRARILKLPLQLGREKVTFSELSSPLPYWFCGRVVLDYGYLYDYGVAGLIERARFSFLPPGLASRWTANGIIDSRNCYELIKRGYVIPRKVSFSECIRTLDEVVVRDRGGLILAPKISVIHENVAELDFESEYPTLIVKEGLSYETVTPEGVIKKDDAFLPYVTKLSLGRRLRYKRLRKKFDESSKEWLWCEQRQLALKMILVCLYGTSGCCWNRFGNILCFEEINRRSRRILVETKNFVQEKEFEVVYADTDSIFIKKKGATREAYEDIAEEISQHVDLPIALDHHYKFLLLLPLESDPSGNMEAQKNYLGLLTDGELLTRGIECRRHDCPPFIKNFQENLIRTLFDVETPEEVYSIGYKKALHYVFKTVDMLMSREVPIERLVVSKILRKPLSEYTRLLPHVSASINLAQKEKIVKKGETVDFVYVNSKHHNPLRRVVPIEIYDKAYYDPEKYREMVLDASETVLSTLGFSRQQFNLKPPIRSFSEALLLELKEEMNLEKETEEFKP
jgi:DNA polymerase elongation subunit (family B)